MADPYCPDIYGRDCDGGGLPLPDVRGTSEPGIGDVPPMRKYRPKPSSLEHVRRFGPVTFLRTYARRKTVQIRLPRRWAVDVYQR